MNPWPKPWASRSKAWRELALLGSLPASLSSSLSARTGVSERDHDRQRDDRQRPRMRSAPSRSSGAMRVLRRCRRSGLLLPSCRVAAGRARLNRPARASLGRTSRGPKRGSSAGSSVSEATSVSSTAITAAIARPYMNADAGREHAEQGDHHGRAGEQDRPAGGVHRLDDRRFDVAEREIALAEAGDDEQRVVDPDAEADHQRQIGRDVRHVRHVGRQCRSARRR